MRDGHKPLERHRVAQEGRDEGQGWRRGPRGEEGRRLLAPGGLEALAREKGARGVLHLETNRALGEAIELSRGAGFEEVAPFNGEPYAHHWFEKALS